MGKVFNKTLKLAQSAVFDCRRVEIALVDQRLRFARNRADSSAFSI
jgi:hypothetical protein